MSKQCPTPDKNRDFELVRGVNGVVKLPDDSFSDVYSKKRKHVFVVLSVLEPVENRHTSIRCPSTIFLDFPNWTMLCLK